MQFLSIINEENIVYVKKFLVSNKKPILIFLTVLLIELLAILALSKINGIQVFFRGDGRDYQNLANNLIYHNTLAITPNPPYLPTSFRTPIYPFWLAFIYWIFRSYNIAIFIGAFIFALSAPIAYLIGREIFTEKMATIAALLSSLEPWAIYQSGFLTAEQIFLPIFLLSAYLFCRYLKSGYAPSLYLSAAILGVAALTRPATLFFVAVYMFLAFIFELRHSFRASFKASAIVFIIFIVVLIPWLVRNRIVLNSWQFSSASGIRIFSDYIMLEKYIGKIKLNDTVDIYEEAKKILNVKTDIEAITIVENSEKLTRFALNGIRNHIGLFLKLHFENTALFFLKNSYGNIFFDLGIKDSNVQSTVGNYLIQSEFIKTFNIIIRSSFGAKILFILTLFWPFVAFLLIIGILKLFQKDFYNLLYWFLILWIGYFPSIVAWGDVSRYRLAIHVPLFLIATFAIFAIRDYLKNVNN